MLLCPGLLPSVVILVIHRVVVLAHHVAVLVHHVFVVVHHIAVLVDPVVILLLPVVVLTDNLDGGKTRKSIPYEQSVGCKTCC